MPEEDWERMEHDAGQKTREANKIKYLMENEHGEERN